MNNMSGNQIRLLSKMKKLVRNKCCRFEKRTDYDYLEELRILEITEEQAWDYILNLKPQFYSPDTKSEYEQTNDLLIFTRMINGKDAYIKIYLGETETGEEVVCLSFHKSRKAQ